MKLILKGHTLTFEGSLPAQYSANVPIQFVNDDLYKDYTPSVNLRFYCHSKQYDTSILINEGVFLLPGQFFNACGKAYISVLNKRDDVEVNSYPLALDVVHSVDAGDALPDEMTWREFVERYVEECVEDIEVSGGGTSDYSELNNKPQINGTELTGNKTANDLGLVDKATLEALEEIVAKKLNDILVNGASIVENGVANIPVATKGVLGVVKPHKSLQCINDELGIYRAMASNFENRSYWNVVDSQNIDLAVKTALCDGKGEAYTSEEKASARDRFGLEWRYVGKVETTEDVAKITMSLDENGQPFNLRKLYVKVVNYPNASDLTTQIRLTFNGRNESIFHDSNMMTGVKSTETMKICEVVVEKIANHLVPISIYTSSNNTNVSMLLIPHVQYAYRQELNEFDDNINQVSIYTWTNAIGAGAYIEVWGVDA